MSARQQQKQQSHAVIVDAAAHLVRQRGIAGARVADIMAAAGLTVGGFYAHFASKAELVDAALRRTGAVLRARLFAGLDDKPAAQRALVVVKRYLSAAHRDQEPEGCPLPAVVGEIGTSAPEHTDVLREYLEALVQGIERTLPARRRPRALALLALMYGGLSLARALRGTSLSDELLRACRDLGGELCSRAM